MLDNFTYKQVNNEAFWSEFCDLVESAAYSSGEALKLVGQFQKKIVNPTALFKGNLIFGDPKSHPDFSICIAIQMFAKTMQSKKPAAKKWLNSIDNENAELKSEPRYSIKRNGKEILIGMRDLEYAYEFGKAFVPVRMIDEECTKLETFKELSIIGMIDRNKVTNLYLLIF